jgi:hypothetical protein
MLAKQTKFGKHISEDQREKLTDGMRTGYEKLTG